MDEAVSYHETGGTGDAAARLLPLLLLYYSLYCSSNTASTAPQILPLLLLKYCLYFAAARLLPLLLL
jgi:hypothetical protein